LARKQGVDDIISIKRVKAFALVQVPQHGSSVFTTRGAKRAIRGDGHGVQVASVAFQVYDELAACQGPDLHEVVPTTGHDEWVYVLGRETNA